MRLEVGVDVVAIGRIQKAVERFGERFLKRVFTANEVAYSTADSHQWEHLAGRFAAKEAASKALGTGMVGVAWRDFEVLLLPSGKPRLSLTGRASEVAEKLGLREWTVSLAHDAEAGVAVATVIAWGFPTDGAPANSREVATARASRDPNEGSNE